jgi:hypothetical protein
MHFSLLDIVSIHINDIEMTVFIDCLCYIVFTFIDQCNHRLSASYNKCHAQKK